jgi:hypothetical protein
MFAFLNRAWIKDIVVAVVALGLWQLIRDAVRKITSKTWSKIRRSKTPIVTG